MKNNQKGITLVALVITIIVLLILAGVTIASLSGDNGILNRGKEAKQMNEIGQAIDQINLIAQEAIEEHFAVKYAEKTTSTKEIGTNTVTAETIKGHANPGETVQAFIDSELNTNPGPGKIGSASVTKAGNEYTVTTSDGTKTAKGTVNDSGDITWVK